MVPKLQLFQACTEDQEPQKAACTVLIFSSKLQIINISPRVSNCTYFLVYVSMKYIILKKPPYWGSSLVSYYPRIMILCQSETRCWQQAHYANQHEWQHKVFNLMREGWIEVSLLRSFLCLFISGFLIACKICLQPQKQLNNVPNCLTSLLLFYPPVISAQYWLK